MMDCGMKTLMFLTLCSLVGAQTTQKVKNDLEILVTVPSTHIGDTEIVSASFSASANHPFKYTVGVQKNETQCINSTNPLCTSLIKEPKVDVSVSSKSSNGKIFTYTNSINRSQEFIINVDTEVSVRPQMMNVENNKITVILDVTYNKSRTSYGSFSSSRKPAKFSLNTEFFTTTTTEDDGQGNGQCNLSCGPLSVLILLALLQVLLLK